RVGDQVEVLAGVDSACRGVGRGHVDGGVIGVHRLQRRFGASHTHTGSDESSNHSREQNQSTHRRPTPLPSTNPSPRQPRPYSWEAHHGRVFGPRSVRHNTRPGQGEVCRTLPIYPEDSGSPPTSGRRDEMAEQSLYERLGGIYGIATAVDVLVDRLYSNASANMNPAVAKFHEQQGQAGFKFLVTAWTIEHTGGPKCYPGRSMRDAHAHLNVSQHDFDVVALEIAATLSFLGAPEKEHKEFMDLIESYRSMVVAPSA